MIKAARIMAGRIAGFLTVATGSCRQNDGLSAPTASRASIRIFGILVLGATIFAVAATVQAQSWQSNEDIARVAEEFIREQAGQSDPRVTPRAGHLDPRLQLPLCDVELNAFLRPGTKVSSKTAVGVRCSGSRPWKVYVPVEVVVMDAVLVTRKMLPRGHILTAEDVITEKRNVSRLIRGYLARPEDLIGQRLKHQVMGGKVISPSMLAADMVIKRGQSVTLLLRSNGLHITMAGKALMDGAVNQRIKVENTASQRIVEGLVRSPEHVEILVY